MSWLEDRHVALCREAPRYCAEPPFHPSEAYPEAPTRETCRQDNPAYRAVRLALFQLGLDAERFGTPEWSPLRSIVRPGDTVIVKPNLVAHRNLAADLGLTDTDSLVTHGSVIRAVLDHVGRALEGRGRVVVGDCPIQGTSWERVVALTGLDAIRQYFQRTFPNVAIELRDYRLGRAIVKGGKVVERIVDERGIDRYVEVDVGKHSALVPLMQGSYAFGVSHYPRHRMQRAHTPEVNKYLIPRDILEADVLINLPKMKTHCKAGLTCALKNFVGINGHKDYLPHFRFGSPKHGGDEHPDGTRLWDLTWWLAHRDWDLEKGRAKRALQAAQRVTSVLLRAQGYPRDAGIVGGGGWHGNDTLWRTILDVNRAFFYHSNGGVTSTPRDVRYLAILDGLIGGQREAPLAPTPIRSGMLLAGRNPLVVDTAAAALMGLDVAKLRQLRGGYALETLPLARFGPEDVVLRTADGDLSIDDVYKRELFITFEPSRGYKGHIEVDGAQPRGLDDGTVLIEG